MSRDRDRSGYISLNVHDDERTTLAAGQDNPTYSGDLHRPMDVGFSGPPMNHSIHESPNTPTVPGLSDSGAGNQNNRLNNNPMQGSRQFTVEGGSSTKRWDHIKDLDVFFSRIYEFYIRGGFRAMALEEILNLIQIVFIIFISTFFLQCIDYQLMFRKKLPPPPLNATSKLSFKDVIVPNCAAHLNFFIVIILLVAAGFILIKCVRTTYHLIHFWEIGLFYENAMKVDANRMANMTWAEVLQCLIQAQRELHLCIQKRDLTELDIYQRILRHKNYTVALVNKQLLPPRFHVPLIGDVCYMSHGLKMNIEWLLYTGSHSPWQDYFTLRPEYKQRENLTQLGKQMNQTILYVAIVNLVLSPFVFLWTVLYIFFSTAELIKRQPGALGMRTWSLTARYFIRHFNELDHELQARLNRGHRPATQYMEQFASNRLIEIGAQHVAFYAGSVLAVLVVLSVWDEDVLQLEHMLTVMTMCGLVVYGCAAFIADENLVWCPEWLMDVVTAQIHYVPDSWKGHTHTERVRAEFGQLFQYKAYYYFEELVSPFVTPFVLLTCLRPCSYDIIDFFHKFTIDVPGLGDVCSFAQMDVQKHGDPRWNGNWHQSPGGADAGGREDKPAPSDPVIEPAQLQALHGKTEMSLMHFTIRNPMWQPPATADRFLHAFKQQVNDDVNMIKSQEGGEALAENPLAASLTALVAGHQLNQPGSSLGQPSTGSFGGPMMASHSMMMPSMMVRRGRQVMPVSKVNPQMSSMMQSEQPSSSSQSSSLLASLHQSGMLAPPVFMGSTMAGVPGAANGTSMLDESAVVDMNVSALYLHRLHQQRVRPQNYGTTTSMMSSRHSRRPQSTYQPPRSQPLVEEHEEPLVNVHGTGAASRTSALTTNSGLQDNDLWGTTDSAHEAQEFDDDEAPMNFPL